MNRRLPLLWTAALAVLLLLPATSALGAPSFEPTTESMFVFNHNGTDCAARDGFLVREPDSAGSGCGYIYGAPIGEIDRVTGLGLFENPRTYTTEASFAPVLLDTAREVTGVVTVTARESFCASPAPPPVPCVSHAGVGSGVGEVIVDLSFTGRQATGSAKALGSTSVEATILPGQTSVEIPYTITLPASADGTSFRSLSLAIDAHGLHVNTGYVVTDGRTTVDIPTLTPVEQN